MPANNWPFTTNVTPKIWSRPLNLRAWPSPNFSASAPIPATRSSRRGLRGWRKSFCSGSRGWRKNHGGPLRSGRGTLGWLRRQRPVQGFGEAVEDVACRAFHCYALVSQTIEKHAALRSVKRKKARAAKQIRALGVFLFERFGILAEEALRVFFAVQVQAGNQNEFFRLFLLEDDVAVAIPGRRQSLGAVVVEELLQHFLPAEFTHNVFVKLYPVVAEQLFER